MIHSRVLPLPFDEQRDLSLREYTFDLLHLQCYFYFLLALAITFVVFTFAVFASRR